MDLYSGQEMIRVADIAGVAEVCEIIGYSSAYVTMLLNENPDFPRPVTTIKGGRIWDAQAVRAWRATYTPKPPGNPAFVKGAKQDPPARPVKVTPSAEQRAATLDALLGRAA
jgi:predicted DNA-binding transcriptional regulator AlpA